MSVIVVDTFQTVKSDGRTSMQDAFKAAVDKPLATGLQVTIRFASPFDISLAKTILVPNGARVVIDGNVSDAAITVFNHGAMNLAGRWV